MNPHHFQTCCRLCLGVKKEQLEITAIPELPEMLNRLYQLKINPDERCSTSICVDCYYEAKETTNWLRVHRKLKEQFTANQAIFAVNYARTEHVPRIPCQICRKTLQDERTFKQHLKNVHHIPEVPVAKVKNKDPPQCEICGKDFKDARTLTYHKINNHKFRADQTSLTGFTEPQQLNRKVNHSRSTQAMSMYPEELKPRTATKIERSQSISVEQLPSMPKLGPSPVPSLRVRSKSTHQDRKQKEQLDLSNSPTSYRYFCPFCDFSYTRRHRVVSHIRVEHEAQIDPDIIRSEVLDTCPKQPKEPPETVATSKTTYRYYCDNCNYSCVAKNRVIWHLFTEHNVSPHELDAKGVRKELVGSSLTLVKSEGTGGGATAQRKRSKSIGQKDGEKKKKARKRTSSAVGS